MITSTLIRGASLAPRAWKNGGGVTREITAGPADAALDAFAWRLSIANVDAPGAFSTFAGIDRTLVLLDGAGMRLNEAGGRVHVLDAPLSMASFAGETRIHASLDNGPTRDFNVMVRRGVAHSLDVYRDDADLALSHALTFLFCARGALDVTIDADTRLRLEPDDTLRLDAARTRRCRVTCATRDTAWLLIGIDWQP
ncbi:hypothetical protein B0G84_4490 [Paraburkholderia sp. BL8N3]|nr:HutD family protein [Paraburkholderia sp. BL8N3]TCK39160.1 hypothetical protein B0G84_4490 [Paraburkholderia sp. BL8N3]